MGKLFKIPKKRLGYSDSTKEEREYLGSLADDRIIVIKKPVRDRENYIVEAEKQLSDKNFERKFLQDLAETSNDRKFEKKRKVNKEKT